MIELVHEPYAVETMQARKDFAKITNTPLVERPYWFKNTETGKEYHGLYGAIGWPQRVEENGEGKHGYACVVGVRKDGHEAEEATFEVLDEAEDISVDNLIFKCVSLRDKWGFGVHPSLFEYFTGDHLLFELVVAHYNTRLVEARRSEREAFVISQPDDFEVKNAFDIYFRRLQSVLKAGIKRLYLQENEIIKNRIVAFRRDDPAITAIGGMVHTLLIRKMWMDQTTPSVWQTPEV